MQPCGRRIFRGIVRIWRVVRTGCVSCGSALPATGTAGRKYRTYQYRPEEFGCARTLSDMGQGVDGRCGRHAQSGPAAGSFGAQLVENEDGSEIPSFHRQIYELYCEQTGQEADTAPYCDANYTYYIPYQGKPGAYNDGYSIIDLLNGEIPTDAYAGKIVLIGPYAAGMQDEFSTAIDHAGKMYGIEYQANMLDAFKGATNRVGGNIWKNRELWYRCSLWSGSR